MSYNPWQAKPWWCQPWTILLTGAGGIGASWWLFHRWWLTLPLSFLIALWWAYFLVLWPQSLKQVSQADINSTAE